MPEGAPSRAASSPTRSRTVFSRTSSSGRYPPHSRIVETRVARELGTSQAPVREALRGPRGPRRGGDPRRSAAPASGGRAPRELLEAYAVRSELEALGARLGVPRMTDDDLAELEAPRRDDAAGRRGRATATRSPSQTQPSTPGSCPSGRQRDPRARLALARAVLADLHHAVAPGADAHWTADLHPSIIEALRTPRPRAQSSRRPSTALRRGQRPSGRRLGKRGRGRAHPAGQGRAGPTRRGPPPRTSPCGAGRSSSAGPRIARGPAPRPAAPESP